AWANKKLVDCLGRHGVNDDKILTLMGHIAAAQLVWLHRIKGLPVPELKLWGTYRLQQLNDLVENASDQWLGFVNSEDNFDRDIVYRNSAGQPYTSNVEMIMLHVVTHSSYHRAQIAMLLRQAG